MATVFIGGWLFLYFVEVPVITARPPWMVEVRKMQDRVSVMPDSRASDRKKLWQSVCKPFVLVNWIGHFREKTGFLHSRKITLAFPVVPPAIATVLKRWCNGDLPASFPDESISLYCNWWYSLARPKRRKELLGRLETWSNDLSEKWFEVCTERSFDRDFYAYPFLWARRFFPWRG